MEKSIEQDPDKAQPFGDGLSNEIYFKDDEVIKIFRKYPFTNFYTSILEVLNLRPRYLNRKIRMDNEVEMRKEVRKSGLNSPQITYRGEMVLKYKKAKGETGYTFLNNCSESEAQKLGENLSKFLRKLHKRDSAIRDIRISNCIIEDDNSTSLIDLEYSDTDANSLSKFIDYLQLISSVKQTSNYTAFLRKFDNPYLAQKLATITSLLHAKFLERSLKRTKNAIRNSAP